MPLSYPTLYCTIVGSLAYLTITRPDIAYVVHVVSQFVASPTTVHWTTVLRILRYLRGIVSQSLLLSSTSSLELCAYSDVDYGSDPTNRKSVTGFCTFLGDSLISWKSEKQPIVSLPLKRNIVLWHLLPKRLFGYVGYLQIWEYFFLIPLLCIVTTKVLFRLLTIQSFINEPNTLKLIVTLHIIILSMAPSLSLLFLLRCSL